MLHLAEHGSRWGIVPLRKDYLVPLSPLELELDVSPRIDHRRHHHWNRCRTPLELEEMGLSRHWNLHRHHRNLEMAWNPCCSLLNHPPDAWQ